MTVVDVDWPTHSNTTFTPSSPLIYKGLHHGGHLILRTERKAKLLSSPMKAAKPGGSGVGEACKRVLEPRL